jgi:rubrerythrin
MTYAWKSEQQHRELIVKIQKATSSLFGLLVNKIEGKDSHFHVCQVCGSTLLKKTSEKCPICNHTGDYKEVTPLPATSCPVKSSETLNVR